LRVGSSDSEGEGFHQHKGLLSHQSNNAMPNHDPVTDARQLRQQHTESEALLWSLLRDKQVCGLKFRRQNPVPPFILDFACVSKKLCVELDGDYHDTQPEKDLDRESWLRGRGWDTIRFSNDNVNADPELVAIAIARHLGLDYAFTKRSGGLSSVADRQRIRKDRQQRKLEE
jgi:very-short-patch-repair endonuclease